MTAKSKDMAKQCLYCLIGLLCLACEGNHTIYQNTHTLVHKIWPTTAIQHFTFQVVDTTQAYDITLLVSNNPTYPYQNLFVSYDLQDEKEHILQKCLKEYRLFDPKTGKPLGIGWNKKKSHQFVLLQGYQFANSGTYHLALTQFMRTEDLAGIEAIGIQVSKAIVPAIVPKEVSRGT
jgi:gliding motility-associated lipoprotein GldH